MDINSLSFVTEFQMVLQHPVTGVALCEDDDPKKPVTFTFFAPGSKHYKAAKMSQQQKFMNIINSKRNKVTAEMSDESEVEWLSTITQSVTYLQHNGKVPTEKENFIDLYSDIKLAWIRDQIREALDNQENFLSKSETN